MAFAGVEIKCEDTLAFYQGYVKDVERDHVLVAYAGGWQRDSWLSISSVRPALAPYSSASFSPQAGEVVEVQAKSAEHEPYSWWRASVKSVRSGDSLPPSTLYEISYAGWEGEFSEMLPKDMLRPFNKQQCFVSGDVEKHSLPLAAQLAPLLTQEMLQPIHAHAGTLALFVQPAGSVQLIPPPSAAFNPPQLPTTEPHIVVIGSKPNSQRAVILLANQLKLLHEQLQQQPNQFPERDPYAPANSQQQQQQQSNQHSRFESHPSSLAAHHHPSHSGGGGGGSFPPRSSSHYGARAASPLPPFSSHSASYLAHLPPSATPPVTLEFHCPSHLMGMVIGKRHKNLYIAENLEGIYKVHVDTESGSIVVLARSAEAANAARSLLELTEQTLSIPSVLVGRVVGKNFSIIKEIESHSGVLRIKVGDDRDHDMEYLTHLALHGIPGVPVLDAQGNPVPAAAQQAGPEDGAGIGAAKDKAGEREKRSAFAVASSYRERGYGRDRRGGGGFYGDPRRDDSAGGEQEEFDIVALEEDKKLVEISIIGSPATVSEAELLLRTHIGLITQIYKLSYDEAMLKREVDALALVVPKLGTGAAGAFHHGYAHGHGHGYADKHRGRGGAKDDAASLPAWMRDAPAPKERRSDPAGAGDMHAARSDARGAAMNGDATTAAPSAAAAAGAASAGGVSSGAEGSSDSEDGGEGGDAAQVAGGASVQRRRGGRKLKEKRMRREQRDGQGQADGRQRGSRGGQRRTNGQSAPDASAAAPAPAASQ